MSTKPKADPELVEVFDTLQESEAMVVHGVPGPLTGARRTETTGCPSRVPVTRT